MDDNLPPSGRVSGNPDLDRKMFEFGKRKWEDEQRYSEFERQKWEAEERQKEFERQKWEAERQESTRRWEAEREDRKAEIKLKEAEFGLKKN